jgi:uncharacterized membrane protein YhaH (DUF805 family)
MGPISAVVSCYVNIVNFSGRARRSEYWWFFLFLVLVGIGAQVALGISMLRNPAFAGALQDPVQMQAWLKQNDGFLMTSGAGTIAYILLGWLPQLSVTVRRLHDTNRSGWFIFMPALVGICAVVASIFMGIGAGDDALPLLLLILSAPAIAYLWFFIVLCLPGTHGTNRFGPDPIKGRKRRAPDHPAFATSADPEERATLEALRRAEIKEYYRKNVLANGTRA